MKKLAIAVLCCAFFSYSCNRENQQNNDGSPKEQEEGSHSHEDGTHTHGTEQGQSGTHTHEDGSVHKDHEIQQEEFTVGSDTVKSNTHQHDSIPHSH